MDEYLNTYYKVTAKKTNTASWADITRDVKRLRVQTLQAASNKLLRL